MGTDENMDEKMNRLIGILPQLEGMEGVLHLENVTEDTASVVFDNAAEENSETGQSAEEENTDTNTSEEEDGQDISDADSGEGTDSTDQGEDSQNSDSQDKDTEDKGTSSEGDSDTGTDVEYSDGSDSAG